MSGNSRDCRCWDNRTIEEGGLGFGDWGRRHWEWYSGRGRSCFDGCVKALHLPFHTSRPIIYLPLVWLQRNRILFFAPRSCCLALFTGLHCSCSLSSPCLLCSRLWRLLSPPSHLPHITISSWQRFRLLRLTPSPISSLRSELS